jgi:polyhydroxyalkanoate synthesis repressor PhaR
LGGSLWRQADAIDEKKAMTVSEKKHGAADAKAGSKKEPIVVKKYANRRLYNTDTSTYVTLEDLAQMVRAERDFVVFDAKSGEDLTHTVLTQIIVEQEGRGSSLLPVPFLRQLIRFYGDNMGAFVPSYLQMSMENLTREQEKYRTQFSHLFTGKAFPQIPFGTAAFDAMQAHTRQNMAMFERALGMFSPFQPGGPHGAQPGDQTGAAPHQAGANGAGQQSAAVSSSSRRSDDSAASGAELAELKAQMQAMQAKLEKMANSKG